MSRTFNAQELIDRYVHAVRFWLPGSQHADIPAELSEDLRSQIDEKEAEIGRPLSEDEVMAILKRCGPPIVVASRYRGQASLIGPLLFPIYQFVLKVVLLWVLSPIFLVIIGPAMIWSASDRWAAFFSVFGTFCTALFMSAAVITLVFAILERSSVTLKLTDWDQRSLPPLPKNPQQSRGQSIFEFVLAVVGVFYLLAAPHYPFLLLGPAASFLKISPAFAAAFYWPLVVIAMSGVALRGLGLMRPQWTWYPAAAQLISTAIGLAFVKYVINVAAQASPGDWHPYVVLVVAPTVQLKKMEAIVNASLLMAMAGAWIGMSIAAVIQAWQLLRQIRISTARRANAAVLHLL